MRLSTYQVTQVSEQLINDLQAFDSKLKPKQIVERIENSNGLLLCATFNQRHVAYTWAEKNGVVLELLEFEVRDITRRRGVGVFLFQQLAGLAKQQQFESLRFPETQSPATLGFYRHLGIVPMQDYKL
ncbi:GNAT family N-acetyltransferase [Alginatibacterium sediminis]|uniref:GNAT family N-acetyltransferase n=1 Tax=Alginatibacterium sediminis TaxID=2164068 RepID=A0A420ELA2_9ALTE|nr:acetyl-CoA sensor PanZ family protein [Alginatibacterium sediminis]RKF21492.1 GNAT family N-acetyltransferase [Alginatibacterium sediminis]